MPPDISILYRCVSDLLHIPVACKYFEDAGGYRHLNVKQNITTSMSWKKKLVFCQIFRQICPQPKLSQTKMKYYLSSAISWPIYDLQTIKQK